MSQVNYGSVFRRFAEIYSAELLAGKVTITDLHDAINSGGVAEDLYKRGSLSHFTKRHLLELTKGGYYAKRKTEEGQATQRA